MNLASTQTISSPSGQSKSLGALLTQIEDEKAKKKKTSGKSLNNIASLSRKKAKRKDDEASRLINQIGQNSANSASAVPPSSAPSLNGLSQNPLFVPAILSLTVGGVMAFGKINSAVSASLNQGNVDYTKEVAELLNNEKPFSNEELSIIYKNAWDYALHPEKIKVPQSLLKMHSSKEQKEEAKNNFIHYVQALSRIIVSGQIPFYMSDVDDSTIQAKGNKAWDTTSSSPKNPDNNIGAAAGYALFFNRLRGFSGLVHGLSEEQLNELETVEFCTMRVGPWESPTYFGAPSSYPGIPLYVKGSQDALASAFMTRTDTSKPLTRSYSTGGLGGIVRVKKGGHIEFPKGRQHLRNTAEMFDFLNSEVGEGGIITPEAKQRYNELVALLPKDGKVTTETREKFFKEFYRHLPGGDLENLYLGSFNTLILWSKARGMHLIEFKVIPEIYLDAEWDESEKEGVFAHYNNHFLKAADYLKQAIVENEKGLNTWQNTFKARFKPLNETNLSNYDDGKIPIPTQKYNELMNTNFANAEELRKVIFNGKVVLMNSHTIDENMTSTYPDAPEWMVNQAKKWDSENKNIGKYLAKDYELAGMYWLSMTHSEARKKLENLNPHQIGKKYNCYLNFINSGYLWHLSKKYAKEILKIQDIDYSASSEVLKSELKKRLICLMTGVHNGTDYIELGPDFEKTEAISEILMDGLRQGQEFQKFTTAVFTGDSKSNDQKASMKAMFYWNDHRLQRLIAEGTGGIDIALKRCLESGLIDQSKYDELYTKKPQLIKFLIKNGATFGSKIKGQIDLDSGEEIITHTFSLCALEDCNPETAPTFYMKKIGSGENTKYILQGDGWKETNYFNKECTEQDAKKAIEEIVRPWVKLRYNGAMDVPQADWQRLGACLALLGKDPDQIDATTLAKVFVGEDNLSKGREGASLLQLPFKGQSEVERILELKLPKGLDTILGRAMPHLPELTGTLGVAGALIVGASVIGQLYEHLAKKNKKKDSKDPSDPSNAQIWPGLTLAGSVVSNAALACGTTFVEPVLWPMMMLGSTMGIAPIAVPNKTLQQYLFMSSLPLWLLGAAMKEAQNRSFFKDDLVDPKKRNSEFTYKDKRLTSILNSEERTYADPEVLHSFFISQLNKDQAYLQKNLKLWSPLARFLASIKGSWNMLEATIKEPKILSYEERVSRATGSKYWAPHSMPALMNLAGITGIAALAISGSLRLYDHFINKKESETTKDSNADPSKQKTSQINISSRHVQSKQRLNLAKNKVNSNSAANFNAIEESLKMSTATDSHRQEVSKKKQNLLQKIANCLLPIAAIAPGAFFMAQGHMIFNNVTGEKRLWAREGLKGKTAVFESGAIGIAMMATAIMQAIIASGIEFGDIADASPDLMDDLQGASNLAGSGAGLTFALALMNGMTREDFRARLAKGIPGLVQANVFVGDPIASLKREINKEKVRA